MDFEQSNCSCELLEKNGRCVAGIDSVTGEWKRPIPSAVNSVVPLTPQVLGLNLLDIADVSFTGNKPVPPDEFQIENEFVANCNWQQTGTATIAQVRNYCQNTGLILHSSNDYVDPAVMAAIPSNQWKSLQLIEVRTTFTANKYQRNRWRGQFDDSLGDHLDLSVTDPVATNTLNQGVSLDGLHILCVSLGQAFAYANSTRPAYCYKFIAGVI